MFFKRKKVILILGPTAIGKSKFAIEYAKKNNGEIISVDSRQIFKEIPFFSGAVSEAEMDGVKHHLVGELSLEKKDEYNISIFKEKVFPLIESILERKKNPILVGGSSFFFEAVVYENFLPEVEPDFELRKELEKKTNEELFLEIQKRDLKTAERIDSQNRHRLIRALEIILKNGFVPELKKSLNKKYDFEVYFLTADREVIKKRIERNFFKRVGGVLLEAEILKNKILAEKFQQLGLAYKNILDFWEGKIDKNKFTELGILEEQKYAKRQMTYLNKFFNSLPEKKIFKTGVKKKKIYIH